MAKIDRKEYTKEEVISKMTMKQLKKVARWLYDLSAPYKKKILFFTIWGIINVGLGLLYIWLTKSIIDIATNAQIGNFWLIAFVLIALSLFQISAQYLVGYYGAKFSVEVSNGVRYKMFATVLRSKWYEQEKFHTGDILTRIKQDASEVVGFLVSSFPSFVITFVQLIASFIFLFYLDKMLALIILCVSPIFFLFSKLYVFKMRKYSLQLKKIGSDMNSMLQESVQHQVVVKTLEYQEPNLNQLGEIQDFFKFITLKRTKFGLNLRSVFTFGFSGGYMVAFLWGVYQLKLSAISFGTLTAFLQLVNKIQGPVAGLIGIIPGFINVYTAVERLLELEDMSTEEKGDPVNLGEGISIDFTDVTFAYDKEPVLKSLNLHFEAGEFTAIIGETGCGKTTVMRLMLALLEPQKGQILLKKGSRSEAVSALTRCNFIYVPQGNTLFSGTIRDNLRMAKENATDKEMEDVLRVAAADFVFDLPQGIDTSLQEFGQGLSEGQAQRILANRSLLRGGNILLLDEVTSAVDELTESKIIQNLRVFAKDKTVIFVTHRLKIADKCDKVIKM